MGMKSKHNRIIFHVHLLPIRESEFNSIQKCSKRKFLHLKQATKVALVFRHDLITPHAIYDKLW
jgi:hypothetical protein